MQNTFLHRCYIVLLCCLPLGVWAQKSKTWVVFKPTARTTTSLYNIKLEKVELTEKHTIMYMHYVNYGFGNEYIEACNTFHIRSNGQKVAEFVRAENIPTRNTRREGFSCADIDNARVVRPGERVRFKIYFTRIPDYLNSIDIIEYNGKKSCEFDIWDLNISQKRPLAESQKGSGSIVPTAPTKPAPAPPSVAAVPKPTPKPKVVPPAAKPSKPAPAPPVVTAPAATEKAKPTPTPALPAIKPEVRRVSVKKQMTVAVAEVNLEIYDNDQEDGDIVSIMLNGRWVSENVAVRKKARVIRVPLKQGENTLTLHAVNLGTRPPNTAAVRIIYGEDSQVVVLNADMSSSEAIKIYRK